MVGPSCYNLYLILDYIYVIPYNRDINFLKFNIKKIRVSRDIFESSYELLNSTR